MREPWLSFTKDSTTLNFLKFLIFCNNYYGNYLVHPHKILPAWLRFKLNAMEQVLPAYTVENEIHICLGIWDTEIKKNYLYKNENHFASVGQRANLCLGKFYRLILLPDKWNTAHNSALCTTGETACRVFRALELQSSCPEFNPLHNSCSW